MSEGSLRPGEQWWLVAEYAMEWCQIRGRLAEGILCVLGPGKVTVPGVLVAVAEGMEELPLERGDEKEHPPCGYLCSCFVEFGVHLAELTVDPHGALAIRQLASVILKQYVETHWCAQSEKYRPPETTEWAKAAIRELLPSGLREAISKVRSSVAYALSAIAHWDWPEAWPGLFKLLMDMLASGDVNAVHGAMRVLTEFTREVTDVQMPDVAPVILPQMYKIFTMAEVYSIRTRSRAVEIFTTCANLICAIDEVAKGAATLSLLHLTAAWNSHPSRIERERWYEGVSLKKEIL
ncbi:importin-9-like [Sinocyclocheilus grahami]|uniref:importin-9-like n=1 Tax=Sinocyclocheilus grahami TaxID=75366 RepID=UPI0007AD3974|nr:PREDICTED: importin-9-like [Sinocyclocheilus grahami]